MANIVNLVNIENDMPNLINLSITCSNINVSKLINLKTLKIFNQTEGNKTFGAGTRYDTYLIQNNTDYCHLPFLF